MSSEILQAPKLNLPRLLLLGCSSVVLCLSYLMSIFSPFPIVMATLLYGRLKGYGIALIGILVCFGISTLLFQDSVIVWFYGVMVLVSFVVAESLKRDWNPLKTIVLSGLGFFLITLGIAFSLVNSNKVVLKDLLVKEITQTQSKLVELQKKSPGEVSLADVVLTSAPEKLAQEILENTPSFLLMGIFFILWANMFLSLKSRRMIVHAEAAHFSENNLLKFKMPLYWVYLVIIGLVLLLGGAEYIAPWAPPVGISILRVIGTFYFFQGFGVMTNALDQFGVFGFLRTLLVMGVILFAPYMVAALGLFDTWFDFDKKLKKQFKE